MNANFLGNIPGLNMNDTEQANEEFTNLLRRYLRLFWHWMWLILLVAGIGGSASFLISQQVNPVYETTTTLIVETSGKSTDYNAVLHNQRQIKTYSLMMLNEEILQKIIEQLDLSGTPSDLADYIEVTPVQDAQLINITVIGSNPALISRIANTLVDVFIAKINMVQSDRFSSSKESLLAQLYEVERLLEETKTQQAATDDLAEKDSLETNIIQYTQIYATLLTNYEQARLAENQDTTAVVQLNLAQAPEKPVGPNILGNTILAAMLGVVLTTGGIYLADKMDDTICTPEQASEVLGLPVLGVIQYHQSATGLITQTQPRSPISESFRVLRTNLQHLNVVAPIRSIIITSPSAGEGKTMVGSNLAVVLAQDSKNVILIDTDLRRPSIHKKFNIPNSKGLISAVRLPDTLKNGILQTTETVQLLVMASGGPFPYPNELLGSNKMRELLDKLKGDADILVLDTPPVLPVADAAVLAQTVDGVIIVLKAGQTSLSAARQAVQQLRQVDARILGIVMNGVRLSDYRYGYAYRKGYYPSEQYLAD
jgi:polysaccharide biosynthesis transport protein